MAMDEVIQLAQDRLRSGRSEGDFPEQLAAYMQLARLWERRGAHAEAVENLRRAAKVAEYLGRPNEEEAIYHALLAVHERADDVEGLLSTYQLLHIHWNMRGDTARGAQYNDIRLELVARRIGKKEPSVEERFRYEYELSCRHMARTEEHYWKLLEGFEDPVIPDEIVEAFCFLLNMLHATARHDEELRCLDLLQRRIPRLGLWITPKGLEAFEEIKKKANEVHSK